MIETTNFQKIGLEEMDQVRLMNRTDTKYWFHRNQLNHLFSIICNDYYILEIDGCTQLPYQTTYYDTLNDDMFQTHHRRKLTRYKVRRRCYEISGTNFLEIKYKNNKGRTMKRRIGIGDERKTFSPHESDFILKNSPFKSFDLQKKLDNRFNRIMLVSKRFDERCTIDLNLTFHGEDQLQQFDDLVVVEIKCDGRSNQSPLALALRSLRMKPTGFSKYCIGRSVTDKSLKRNNFKMKLRMLQKTLELSQQLY